MCIDEKLGQNSVSLAREICLYNKKRNPYKKKKTEKTIAGRTLI